MPQLTLGIMSPGDMGHVVAGVLNRRGHRVLTLLEGRSELTRERAKRSSMEDAGSLDRLVGSASVVLSIMPPERALGFARDVAGAMAATGKAPLFVDCNAVSPDTTRAIHDAVAAAGGEFLKVGIIGPPPGGARPTRFYASGPAVDRLSFLDGDGIRLVDMGPDIARAAAIKMCYAALTKGKMTLHTAVLIAGEMLGESEELHAEFAASQNADWEAMNARVPFYPCDAGRWSGEMEEIAATFGGVGVTPNRHKGAAEVFRFLDSTPIASETRETADRSRTLAQALDIYVSTLAERDAAE